MRDIEKHKQRKKEFYERNKELTQQRTRDRRGKILAFVQEYKEARACVDCGTNYPYWILEFDHVHGEKLGNISTMVKNCSMNAILEEIEKCDVVCSNCHRTRTRNRLISSKESILE